MKPHTVFHSCYANIYFLQQCIRVPLSSTVLPTFVISPLFNDVGMLSHSVVSDCDPMDYSLPGSFFYAVFQARILEWVAISFSRRSSWPKDQTHISCIGRQIVYHWVTWEALFGDSHPVSVRLICISLIITNVEYLLIYLWCIWIVSLENCNYVSTEKWN